MRPVDLTEFEEKMRSFPALTENVTLNSADLLTFKTQMKSNDEP